MEYFYTCPYCWQEVSVILDLSVQQQTIVEDCEVCCNPIEFRYEISEGEITNFEAIKIQ
ncbi:MAG TPA: CPXCG motif-containing cysteine-rich protein [Ignavibacteria bacterium]|nr:CPXCG motif-containing cysteine-rich protein [Bacteroidota bacterium]HRE10537.1 CPXCG motif-containing cysteine-rich protein [Ignavibacteria bacterium]HRF64826.1 CPXCG motif-containing cysteine-rich protein [Ignavibacteria bacterium]HRJ04588.1 CPXCG motif-containing cysteine-rich protein [Ignavibacteria bacterium]HRJ85887.1 CPXCG motif-containing cysteine-rich protein [Ignavibacteria bacterium]